jgi:hypothetical protein
VEAIINTHVAWDQSREDLSFRIYVYNIFTLFGLWNLIFCIKFLSHKLRIWELAIVTSSTQKYSTICRINRLNIYI